MGLVKYICLVSKKKKKKKLGKPVKLVTAERKPRITSNCDQWRYFDLIFPSINDHLGHTVFLLWNRSLKTIIWVLRAMGTGCSCHDNDVAA